MRPLPWTSDTTITKTLVITGKTLTLDLNGYVLKMTGKGSVLYVYNGATLTIQDSSANGAAAIPGLTAGDGGGVHIGGGINESEGRLVMTGGTITGCKAVPSSYGSGRGGGVFVFKGSFTMSGTARITDCTAAGGGGVLVHFGACTFTMNGGEISDCKASNTGGGVCLFGGAWFEMTGGTIQKCTAGDPQVSSAIYMNPGTMKAHGGTLKGDVWAIVDEKCGITHNSSGYTIFDGTITFVGSSNTTAMYPVKFELDGGSADRLPKAVLLGTALSEPAAPTKSGYTFIGWYLDDTLYNFNTPVTAPLTLTAKWEKVPSSGGYYYYAPPAEQPIEAPKTADPGIALYAALSLLSLTGLTCTAKKR